MPSEIATIFGFWTDGSAATDKDTLPTAACEAWRKAWPDHQVWRDSDVRPLLVPWSIDALTLYNAIRIPACRSDLARLVILHHSGGLYVDLHAAPGTHERLEAVLALLRHAELVIFDESAERMDDRHTWLMNGALAARPGSVAIGHMIRTALQNLREQYAKERAAPGMHVDYSIFDLTGPAVIWHEIFDRVSEGGKLKSAYHDRIAISPVDADASDQPLYFHRHTGFRTIEAHWSRRQKTERLFDI